MITLLACFFLSIVPVRQLTMRWKTPKGACLAAIIGVACSIVGTPIVSVLAGFAYNIDIVDTLISGMATSLLSVLVSPSTAYLAWKRANSVHKRLVSECPQCSTAVGIEDEKCDKCGIDLVLRDDAQPIGNQKKEDSKTLSSGRNRFRRYLDYAAPKRIVLMAWLILSLFLIFTFSELNKPIKFWVNYVQYAITGERSSVVIISTEIKGEPLWVPPTGLIPGTRKFAKAKKLFPSYSTKSDAALKEHLYNLAEARFLTVRSQSFDYLIIVTPIGIVGGVLFLIFMQLAYLIVTWSAKKFLPTPYSKKCVAISASWMIASFTWALIHVGDDTFDNYDFFYERIIIYPPIAFALVAFLWGWANRVPAIPKPDN